MKCQLQNFNLKCHKSDIISGFISPMEKKAFKLVQSDTDNFSSAQLSLFECLNRHFVNEPEITINVHCRSQTLNSEQVIDRHAHAKQQQVAH